MESRHLGPILERAMQRTQTLVHFVRYHPRWILMAVGLVAAGMPAVVGAQTGESKGYLESIRRHITRTSTVPDNGDLNPYAIVVAPVSAGKIQKDDVLVTNFNNVSNLQGTGGTIIDYNPSSKRTTLFASLPQHLPQCPGGVGLGTAMTMLQSGWVIVGSTPSTDGTTRTKGDGCLLVLDADGQLVATWTGPNINGPWGNMATIDRGTSLALAPDHTLYVSDALGNQIVAIPEATTRSSSAGTGRTVTKDGLLKRPLAMAMAPNGNLLVTNAKNGQVVEVNLTTGKQLYAQWIDANQAQSPPGNGDLFGIAMTLDGKGFYYVEDDVNTLVEATP